VPYLRDSIDNTVEAKHMIQFDDFLQHLDAAEATSYSIQYARDDLLLCSLLIKRALRLHSNGPARHSLHGGTVFALRFC
jgi:hypothetical protein